MFDDWRLRRYPELAVCDTTAEQTEVLRVCSDRVYGATSGMVAAISDYTFGHARLAFGLAANGRRHATHCRAKMPRMRYHVQAEPRGLSAAQ